MKHDLQRPRAPGEEDRGPGAIIGTCYRCGKKGAAVSDDDCAGALVDELVLAMQDPPPLEYPELPPTVVQLVTLDRDPNHAIGGTWATPNADNMNAILDDVERMSKLIYAQALPPRDVRPWCCSAAMVANAKRIFVEGNPHPLFVCEKHLGEIMKLAKPVDRTP